MTDFPIPTHPSWLVLDNTKLSDYKRCHRLAFFRHFAGIKRAGNTEHDLQFGIWWHDIMEAILLGGEAALPDVMRHIKAEWEAAYGSFDADDPETYKRFKNKTLDRLASAALMYISTYRNDSFHPLKTELSNSIALDREGKYVIYFRLDSVVEEPDKRITVLEHKTTSLSLDANWQAQFTLRSQILTYLFAVGCCFTDSRIRGVLINGVSFQKTAITFDRILIKRSPIAMQCWLDGILQDFEELHRDLERLSHDNVDAPTMQAFRMNDGACLDFCRLCQYHTCCTSWGNPLPRLQDVEDYPPDGFEAKWWDPTKA